MAVTLTERAAQHITNFIAKRGKGVGFRLGVRTSGCSGMAYTLEFADEIAKSYEIYKKIVTDAGIQPE